MEYYSQENEVIEQLFLKNLSKSPQKLMIEEELVMLAAGISMRELKHLGWKEIFTVLHEMAKKHAVRVA